MPFRHIYGSAARLLVRYDGRLCAQTAALQTVWLAAFLSLAILIHRRGVRKLNVNGG